MPVPSAGQRAPLPSAYLLILAGQSDTIWDA
jgi:hypothetical protein